jgi:hypothetical protein
MNNRVYFTLLNGTETWLGCNDIIDVIYENDLLTRIEYEDQGDLFPYVRISHIIVIGGKEDILKRIENVRQK